MNVSITAVQFLDGSIDGSKVDWIPRLSMWNRTVGLTSAQAREPAAVIIECADEVDGSAQQ